MDDWSTEETDDPHYADRRNFYKVEKWSKDGMRVVELLFACPIAIVQPPPHCGSQECAFASRPG